jgi:C4-dicarboxylate transporter, DctM subunit
MILVILLVLLIAILGAPLFAIIAALTLINFLSSGSNIMIVPQEMTNIVDMQLLYSIPLFTFAGYILANSKASHRLVRFTKAAIGWLPGGLPIVTLVTCALFTAFTGASGVTIVALGAFLLPALISEKYNEKFSYGLITTSGSIGLLFPPSIAIILFGVIAQASIDKLFIAGILPGIVIIIIYSLYAMIFSRKHGIETTEFSFTELRDAFFEIKWELPLPVLLFGGVYSGFMAVSDAAAFTALYVVVVEVFIMKDIKIKSLPRIMKESMVLVGAILLIMACAKATSNYMIDKQIPEQLFNIIKVFITNKWMFLIILNIFLLISGSFLELFSSLIILVPLVVPIAKEYNVNLIHLGIIFLANLEIGFLLPPFGLNLFISSLRFNKPLVSLFQPTIRFLVLSIMALILITYIPELSIWFIDKPSVVGQWDNTKDDGNIDRFIIKSGGIYFRKQGSLTDIMMSESSPGKYVISKDTITFTDDKGTGSYRYEIYNEGEKILLEDKNNPKERIFYKNQISPHFETKSGRLIGKWTGDSVTLEFHFNGDADWTENGNETKYRYYVKKGKIFFSTSDDDKNATEYRYGFKNGNLEMKGKKKSIELVQAGTASDY